MADLPSNLPERYRIVRRLGSGAFATVYLADDLQMGRPVAIKVVPETADVDDRVLREAQAAAKLNHPHIVTMYEMVREPGHTLLVTEYVEGKTLRERYQEGSLSDREILQMGVQLSQALDHAHRRGVVHRDVKPENIMLASGDSVDVSLMDFGVAQLEDRMSITVDGDLVGTLAYMSPEQIAGNVVDSRSDVYSLALTLYEGFTRRNPQKGKKLQQLLRDVSRPDIPPLQTNRPDLPPEVSDVLAKAMAPDRENRPDAASLGRLLAQAGKAIAEEAPEQNFSTRVRERVALPRMDRERMVFLARHLAAGVFSLVTLLYLLPRVPFYPEVAISFLVIIPPFVSLVWPLAGGILALAIISPPIFAYGPGWGVIYVILAAPTMYVLWRRRLEWAALLPGAMPLAVIWGVGLALLPLTGAMVRRWGPLLGFMAGFVVIVAAGLGAWPQVPFTFSPDPGAPLAAAADSVSPWPVLLEIARFLDTQPELTLQVLLFVVFALPVYAWTGSSRGARMWGATGYLSVLFAAFVLLPILLLGVSVELLPFLAAYVPCAIIGFLSALLISSQGRDIL